MAAAIVIRISKRIQTDPPSRVTAPSLPSLSVHRPSRAARSNGITIGPASTTPFNSIFSSVRGTLFISRLLVPVSSLPFLFTSLFFLRDRLDFFFRFLLRRVDFFLFYGIARYLYIILDSFDESNRCFDIGLAPFRESKQDMTLFE